MMLLKVLQEQRGEGEEQESEGAMAACARVAGVRGTPELEAAAAAAKDAFLDVAASAEGVGRHTVTWRFMVKSSEGAPTVKPLHQRDDIRRQWALC